jgi:hypothetical protein
MFNEQCNTCGAYDDASTLSVSLCAHCKTTLLCQNCRKNHEPYCKYNQKLLSLGLGPTIANMPQPPHRRGHETPETTGPDRVLTKSPVLGAPYTLDPSDRALIDAAVDGVAKLLREESPEPVEPRPLTEGTVPAALDTDAEHQATILSFPTTSGEAGQILHVKDDGEVEWVDAPVPESRPIDRAIGWVKDLIKGE